MGKLPEQDKIALEIYEAAAKENARESKRRRFERSGRRYLGMSQIGKCERALWYDFRGFTPKDLPGQVAMIFSDGNYYEEQVIRHLKLAGYRVDHTGWNDQLAFQVHNGFFCGHADGVIHGVTQRPHILEIKSANAKKFGAFKKTGVQKTYPVYYTQVQAYMGYTDLERALVIVYCKDTSEIYTERIHFNRFDFEALHEKAYRIITANQLPTVGEETQECKWCDFYLHCRTEEGIVMADDRACGSCWYLSWKGLTPCCPHPDHPFVIETWGMCCDDYSYLFDKELGPHKLNRKPKVSADEVVEYQS
jgi:hypothetical protein